MARKAVVILLVIVGIVVVGLGFNVGRALLAEMDDFGINECRPGGASYDFVNADDAGERDRAIKAFERKRWHSIEWSNSYPGYLVEGRCG